MEDVKDNCICYKKFNAVLYTVFCLCIKSNAGLDLVIDSTTIYITSLPSSPP